MTHHPRKAHGVPNWANCFTTDLEGAAAFYGKVFGWTSEEATLADGSPYAIQRLDGNAVAALTAMNAEQQAANVPPHWATYFEVEDVDALTSKVETAGGALVESIRTEPGIGRIAIIRDAVGATLRLWTSEHSFGADVFNAPGAMTWNELMTDKPAEAAAFYETTLGLQAETIPSGDVPYTLLKAGDQMAAGILTKSAAMADNPMTSWDVYFASDDVDATAAVAQSAGGTVLAGPFDVPNGSGRLAVIQDPQGAVFEVIKMAVGPM